jgi:CheY-like chemotaxis protein
MTRILAIEPNPERAQALRQLVHDRLGADLVLADSTAAAIAAMTKQAADLILTSILLPPNDDSQLTNYLRGCDQAGKVPVLLIPPVIEEHQTLMPKTWWSRLARSRKGSPPWPPYDPEAVAGRIRDAVAPILSMDEIESLVDDGQSACDQAGKASVLLIPPVIEDHQTLTPKTWWSRLVRSRKGSPPWPPYDPEAIAGRIRDAVAPALSMDEVESLVDDGQSAPATVTALVCFDKTPKNGRPRADRWAHADLPWLSSVNLSTGRKVKLLNISSSGILIDSEHKLTPGRSTEFQLWGPYKQLIVAARIVRSEESTTGRGARYLTAAAFDFNVDLKA